MALVFTCDPLDVSYKASGEVQCDNWIATEYTDSSNLVAMMDELLGFDLEIFGLIEAALIIAFIVGHSAGKVCRVLGRT